MCVWDGRVDVCGRGGWMCVGGEDGCVWEEKGECVWEGRVDVCGRGGWMCPTFCG